MKVVVMGQGYVGLPLAMAAAEAGHEVVGFEPDKHRLSELAAGRSYVEDIPDALLNKYMTLNTYLPTSYQPNLKGQDVYVITVPTPLKDRMPDLSYVESAAATVGVALREGALVVLESTTHPGTTRGVVVPILEKMSGLSAGNDFHVAFSPERIDPGNTTWTFENTPKIVSGLTMACRQTAALFYSSITETVVTADTLEEAEFAKVWENTFRQANIALVNEAGRLAHAIGVDIWNVLNLAASKPFGFMKFTPGPGVGGHCLPVDPVYLSEHIERETGQPFRFIDLAMDINQGQPRYVVSRLQDGLNERGKALKNSCILALGLAYKADTADTRESPASEVVELLRHKGASVTIVDPYLVDLDEHTEIPFAHLGWDMALGDYDAVVLLTPHTAFDLQRVADEATYVLDTRGVMPTRANIERL